MITREAINVEERTVELSFSSETPVLRWWGFEILDHSPGACDLARLKRAAPLLVNHNTDDQVGVVEFCEISSDRKGRAKVRFSKSARAQEIFQDVQDGIRRLVSVGYEIRSLKLEKAEGEVETYRITSWEPAEISLVPIPADINVGTDRTKPNSQSMFRHPNLRLDTAAPAKEGGAPPAAETPNQTRSEPQPPNIEEIRSKAADKAKQQERERVVAIRKLCALAECPELAERAVNEDWSKDRLQDEIIQKRFPGARPVTPEEQNTSLGLSRKDISRYSVVRAMHKKAQGQMVDGLEGECSVEVAKRTKRDARGFFIPSDVAGADLAETNGLGAGKREDIAEAVRGLIQLQKRTLTASVGTAGGFLIGTDVLLGSMIDLLRNQTLVAQKGATMMGGLVGNLVIPKQAGGGSAYWLGETEDVTLSDQSFGQVALTPKKLGAATRYSRELLKQTNLSVEAFVRQDLMLILAIAKDLAAIAGTGGDQPLGILNTTGIGSVTFGAAPTWAKVVEFETTTETANALMGRLGWLSSPGVRGKWKTTVKVTNQAVFLLEGSEANGYGFDATNQVANNKVLFGNWADLVLADWDGLDVTVDPYTGALGGTTRTIMIMMTDSVLRHPASFTVSSDSGAQ